MGGFNNPVVGALALVRQAIQSPNYQAGSDGWAVRQDGSAEFNDVAVRGSINAGSISAGSIGDSTLVDCDYQGGTLEETAMVFDSGGGSLLVYSTADTSQTFTSSGTFTVPAGVSTLTVECWGAGGGAAGGGLAGGANSGGYGGGGGAYAKKTLTVTPGGVYAVTVGAGGAGGLPNYLGRDGGASSFDGACTAAGGLAATAAHRGTGGTAANSTGDVRFDGGDGGTATGSGGSGGGASAGSSSNGNDGASTSGSSGGAGGAGVTGSSGSGGGGGNANAVGSDGHVWGGGGGGGGGGSSAGAGGAGARGQVVVSYTSAATLVASVASIAGVDQYGHAFPAGVAVAAGDLVAYDPVNGGAETWHTLPLTNGWSNFGTGHVNGKYRLRADNLVEVIGRSSHAAVSGTSVLATALPAAYRPASTQDFDCAVFGNSTAPTATPVLTLDTSGVLTLFDLPSGTTSVSYHIFYSLDA